jgi:hypothetical protein
MVIGGREREREALKTAAEVVVFGWRAADKDESENEWK